MTITKRSRAQLGGAILLAVLVAIATVAGTPKPANATSIGAALAATLETVPPAPPLSLPDDAIKIDGAPNFGPAPTAVPPAPAATAVPVPTVPPAPTAAPGASDYVQRGQAALARIPYNLGSLGYTISFHPGQANYRGLTFTKRNHIEIYVRSSMSDAELAYVIAHEIGHAIDVVRNTGADRDRYMAARGASGSWWPGSGRGDLATPAGDFAECFATWAVGSASHSTYGGCSPVLDLIGELIYN